jgi:membrane-bound lytic murein transglycosylase D
VVVEIKKYLWPFLFVVTLSTDLCAHEFPVPKELKSNVAFWKRVYSEWTTEQIAFSDDQDLGMVYTVIDVPPDTHPVFKKARSAKIKAVKEGLREALAQLDALRPQSELEVNGLARELYLALKDVKRDDKYRRMDYIRAQNGLKNRFEKGYYLAGAHEQEIKLRLREEGLPEDLIAVVFVESLFYPTARSHAGAAGIWQFLKGTAKEFMSVNKLVDERFDPILATEAAIGYMKSARDSLPEWPLVITSYNYGRAGMVRAMNAVNSTDFGVILDKYDHGRFGFAARNYYAEFIAALEVYNDAHRYFPATKQKDPWNYDVVTLGSPVFLRDVVRHDADLAEVLGEFNPALTPEAKKGKEVLPAGFALRVPTERRDDLLAHLASNPKEEKHRADNLVRARHRANGHQTLAQIAGLYDVFNDQLADRLGLGVKMKPKRGTIVSVRSADSRYTRVPEPLYKPTKVLEAPKN